MGKKASPSRTKKDIVSTFVLTGSTATKWRDRMAILRDQVRALLDAEAAELRDSVGRPEKNDVTTSLNRKQIGSTNRDYIIARLKRDAPDLAEKVISKAITAAEGKRQLAERHFFNNRRLQAFSILGVDKRDLLTIFCISSIFPNRFRGRSFFKGSISSVLPNRFDLCNLTYDNLHDKSNI